MGAMFPFFQSLGTAPDCHDFSNIVEWLGNYISQFPQGSGMHLVRSHRLMHAQVPQVLTNRIFSSSGKDFAPPVPVLRSIRSRGVGREAASED